MNALEIKMRHAGTGKRRKRRLGARGTSVKPADKSVHLPTHPLRRRGFKMNPASVKRSRDHRDPVLTVTTYAPQVSAPEREHLVPAVKRFVGKRIFARAVEVDHEIGDPLFGGSYFPVVCLQAEMPAKRRLQVLTVKILSLDFRSLEGFIAYNFHPEPVPLMFVKMLVSPEKQTRPAQKIMLRTLEKFRFIGKIRPFGPLPNPSHEL